MQLLRDMYPNTLSAGSSPLYSSCFMLIVFQPGASATRAQREPQMLQQRALLGKFRKRALQLPNFLTGHHDFSNS